MQVGRADVDLVPWDSPHLVEAWSRRDSAPFRSLIEDVLGHAEELGPSPLAVWRRFSQAIFTGRTEPLDALLPEANIEADADPQWSRLAALVLDGLIDGCPREPSDAIACHLFVYLELLCFWEFCHDHEPCLALVDRFEAWSLSLLARVDIDPEGPSPEAQVARGVHLLVRSLVHQFDAEDALGATDPTRLSYSAASAVQGLAAARSAISGATGSGIPTVRAAVRLLTLDLDATEPYFDLLAEHVGPAAAAFVDNLAARDDDARARSHLEEVIAVCREREKALGDSVFGSEARGHRRSLEAAHRVLVEGAPTPVIHDGELVFIYPFSLPVSSTGEDLVRARLREHFEGHQVIPDGPPVVCGVPSMLDDTPQTDAWAPNLGSEHVVHHGVRLVFPTHRLTMSTATERACQVGVEVRIGGLGNCYVRISMRPGQGECWDAHRLDQLVRLIGDERGPIELTWSSTTTVDRPVRFSGVVDMAAGMVSDIVAYARSLEGLEPDVTPPVRGLVRSNLKRHSHLLLVASRVSAVGPGASHEVGALTDVGRCAGSQSWFAAQRSFATGILDWLTLSPGESEQRVVSGTAVACSGDATVVLATGVPNWKILEARELVEFAASVNGVLAERREWFGDSLAADESVVNGLINPVEGTATGLAADEAKLAAARELELSIRRKVNKMRQLLEETRTFVLSRNHDSRTWLSWLQVCNGAQRLEEALASALESAAALQSVLQSQIVLVTADVEEGRANKQETQRQRRERPIAILLAAFTAFSLIDLFTWSNPLWGFDKQLEVWVAEIALLVVFMVVVIRVLVLAGRDSADEHQGTIEIADPETDTGYSRNQVTR